MRLSLFYHSLVSDWNHGNAHFLRGIVSELLARGHEVRVFEPANGWSLNNLVRDQGAGIFEQFHRTFPGLRSTFYQRETLNLEQIAVDSDVVMVHEWNDPWLVNALAALRNRLQRGHNRDQQFLLLFHDTHHRVVSKTEDLQRFDLAHYDGILVFGQVVQEAYRKHGWNHAIWTWHEAADTRVFYPRAPNQTTPEGDLVWIGNWGDDERRRQLEEFLFLPARQLNLCCNLFGVRYPAEILAKLQQRGIHYHGWLGNAKVPLAFANHKVTVHVPRAYYAQALAGVPTIRPFEAMACGIPLITAPWDDVEGLFEAGADYLMAHTGDQMQQQLRALLHDRARARELTDHALATIQAHHTCAHRVDELLHIIQGLNASLVQSTGAAGNFSTLREAAGRSRNDGSRSRVRI